MKYTVTIQEQVVEERTYEIDAPTMTEAAKLAAALWLEAGIPGEIAVISVDERSYEVTAGNGAAWFSADEIESEPVSQDILDRLEREYAKS